MDIQIPNHAKLSDLPIPENDDLDKFPFEQDEFNRIPIIHRTQEPIYCNVECTEDLNNNAVLTGCLIC